MPRGRSPHLDQTESEKRNKETKETTKKEETASDRKNRRRSTKKNRDVHTGDFTLLSERR